MGNLESEDDDASLSEIFQLAATVLWEIYTVRGSALLLERASAGCLE